MCILLVTTAHPEYSLILLSNRDEFLHRPTARAAFWEDPNSHIFSGRDLARPERGTWLGITRAGRLAVLTNFRESSSAAAIGEKSRGAMVTSFLTSTSPTSPGTSTKDWLHSLLTNGELTGVGGFSLLCGILRLKGDGTCLQDLAVISNRTAAGEDGVEDGAHWIAGSKGETHGLSNSLFDDPWPKVDLGRKLLLETVENAVKEGVAEDVLVESLFAVLNHDTLPVTKGAHCYETELESLRHSIFIPVFTASHEKPQVEGEEESTPAPLPPAEDIASGIPPQLKADIAGAVGSDRADSLDHYCTTPTSTTTDGAPYESTNGAVNGTHPEVQWWRDRKYGTQKQTIILVDKNGRVKYVERTLYDSNVKPVEEEEGDVVCEFEIEGWNE